MTPETALLAAVQAALVASPAVSALVGEQVYDQVPADDQPGTLPYIHIGPIARTRTMAPDGSAAWTMAARLFAESTAFNRNEAWEIGNAVAEFLEGVELALDEPFACVEAIRVTRAGDVFEAKAGFRTVFVDIATTIQKIEEE